MSLVIQIHRPAASPLSAGFDGQLGAAADSRVVTLKGSTTVSSFFSPNLFINADSWIKTALENNGFSVIAVRTSNAGWLGYQLNVEIELNVYNRHTSEEARQNAIRAIEAYTANFGLNKAFFNTTLSVFYDAYVAPGGQAPSVPPRGSSPTGGATNPPSAFLPNPSQASGDGWPSLGSFALGGLSGGVVVGIVLLVFALKR